MKPEEIREMSSEELRRKLEELQRELFNLRFRHVTRELKDTSQLRKVRKDIARVKTILRERELQRDAV